MLLIGIFSGGECAAQSPFNDQKIKEQFPLVYTTGVLLFY
ncbi:unnamed protein product [Tenebrio molitor]|nr:unnamed protein product [Tenebrio molitor]